MKIGCILVLYNPDNTLLESVLNAIIQQVEGIFIADNSVNTNEIFPSQSRDRIIYQKMNGNIGIAGAQNVGINYFLKNEFSHLFFLDQDSILAYGAVDQLMMDLQELQLKSIRVGGIGARPINRQNGKKYNDSSKKGLFYSENLTEVTEIMNSASLIPAKNFIDAGLFEEDLFIDGVDNEWCWRAKHLKSLRFFIDEKVFLSHCLGEGDRYFVTRNIAIPTPFRTYYQFRNYFKLVRRNYVPCHWKILNGLKYFVKFIYFPIFLKPRQEYFKHIIKGIGDGIKKK